VNFKVRGHPAEVHVRLALQGHEVVESFAKRFGVDHERAQTVVTESVLDAMELLGSAYVTKMTRVVSQMTRLRESIHFVYEKVLNGTLEGVDPAEVPRTFEELHAVTRELADPKTWAERDGAAIEPLPPASRPTPTETAAKPPGPVPTKRAPGKRAPAERKPARQRPEPQYPGARPGLADLPTRAPRSGEVVHEGGGRTWREDVKRTGDITLELDVDGLFWKFPELEDGVVLHFPEYGYRVWKEPGTGAIVEELLAGPSVTKARRFTRGEEVLFTASDVSEAYRAAHTERAHGAGSPGLGFDAPYGVAHAVRRINQWLENRGVEQWVRDLRDNAEPGVEYLWTTRTKKTRQTLANREYTISAVVDGQIHELYVFETKVPMDSPPSDTTVQFELLGVSPAAEAFGAPVTRDSQAALDAAIAAGKEPGELPRIERVEPPRTIVEALGRTRHESPELARPSVERTGKRLTKLVRLLDGKLLEHALGTKDVAMVEAIDALTNAVQDLHRDLVTGPADPARTARFDAAITAFSARAARWTDHVTAVDVLALVRQLKALRGQ
jgi:hypothetical protein